ncbi:MAG TPA: hypothetical protein VFI42_12930 [Thermomicrobiaceae bacterium]|nr:hypothetical protein [Thermomicrobiaceae bacterium]
MSTEEAETTRAPLTDQYWYDKEVTEAQGDDGNPDHSRLRELLDQAVSQIETSPAEMQRIQGLVADLERYLGRPITAYSLPDLSVYDRVLEGVDLKYNVCYSIVNTIVSRVCSFRPRAQFVPEHGNYKTQRLARELTAQSDAWAQAQEYQAEATLAFRDSLTGPGGVLKVYRDTEGVELMRVPAWELKLDEDDWKYGRGECSYHVRYITQSQAIRQYGKTPEARALIVSGSTSLAGRKAFSQFANRNGVAMVRIVDAYRRGPGGRHVVMAGDWIASNDEWKHEGHPFVIGVFDRRATGPWGHSAIMPIRSIQDRIDETLDKIDTAHHLAASLVVASSEGTPPEKLTNDVVQHFPKKPGETVEFHSPEAVGPGTYKWWEIQKAMAFEILGVSPNAAQATKPQGVTAAVAIEAVTDLQSDRLSQCSQTWEQTVTKVGDWWYLLEAESDSSTEYAVMDRGQSRRIKFRKGDRQPVIRTFPTSLFGQSIPARLQKAMDAVKAGWFEKEEILRILDVPDLGGITDLQLAEFYFIENFVDEILEDGHYETMDEWASPIKAFEYARRRYLLARADGSYPAEHMGEMRKFLDYIQVKAQEARDKAAGKPTATESAAAAPPPAPPMPPMGAPAPLIPLPPPPVAPAPLPGLTASPEANPIPV